MNLSQIMNPAVPVRRATMAHPWMGCGVSGDGRVGAAVHGTGSAMLARARVGAAGCAPHACVRGPSVACARVEPAGGQLLSNHFTLVRKLARGGGGGARGWMDGKGVKTADARGGQKAARRRRRRRRGRGNERGGARGRHACSTAVLSGAFAGARLEGIRSCRTREMQGA